MFKHIKKLWLLTFIITILVIKTFSVRADSTTEMGVPYKTETLGPNMQLVWTQTAYVPVGILNQNVTLVQPQGLYIKNNIIYVADTGDSRVVELDENGNLLSVIGQNTLSMPTGVFVDNYGNIYVADEGNHAVYKFDSSGKLLQTYLKPTQPLFGKNSPFVPSKVVVDSRGDLYIIGVGSTNGVIELDYAGEFLGYFGVNQSSYTFQQLLADVLFHGNTHFAANLPPSPNNIAIDAKGLIYTLTQNVTNPIKEFNIASDNILNSKIYFPKEKLSSIYVDDNDDMFIVSTSGVIYEYDSFGNLLFMFGGQDDGTQRLGLLKEPSGIVTDEAGNIYVLDEGYSNIEIYQKTDFARVVQQGINLNNEGQYAQSLPVWQQVVRMNSTFALARSSLGTAYFKEGDYAQSLKEYKMANDTSGYSSAYWQIRHDWLQKYLGMTILIIIGLIILKKVLDTFDRRKGIYNGLRLWKRKATGIKIVSQLLLLFRMFKHPADTYYAIKHQHKSSVLAANILYIVFFIEFIITKVDTAFIFNTTNLLTFNIWFEMAVVFGLFALWNIGNYLVSTLSDGEGWFKDVYIGTIYAFAPYIVAMLPIVLLSYGLSLNEAVIYNACNTIFIGWSLLLLFIMVKEIHNYTLKETIINILVTIFSMIMTALIIFIVYMLINQVISFILSLIKEVVARASYS